MAKPYLSKEQALQKAKYYCAYQERSHKEVKEKLYEYGLNKIDVEDSISKLIEENYLNEERFAILFAGGKFRMKQWGRVKIKYELKQKQISVYCINKALKSIDEQEYQKTLTKLFDDKKKTLRTEKNTFVKRKKIQDHLLLKGYETELIRELINEIK